MTKPKTAAKPKATPKAGVAISLRVPEDLAAAIDREAEKLQKERPGSTVHRSDVLREIAYRALMKGK